MGAGVTKLLKGRQQGQRFGEHQRLAQQNVQVERFVAQRLLQQVDNVHHAQQVFVIFPAGDHQPGMLIFFQQRADLGFRRAQIDMLDIVARGHDAADGALVEIKHPLNHPPLLRVEQRAVFLIDDERRGIGIQFGVFLVTAQQAHYRFRGALAQRQVGREKATAVEQRQLV